MRLHAQTATIENGFVYLPRKTPWLAEYLHELTVSPNGRYDDQVDVTSTRLDEAKTAGMGHSRIHPQPRLRLTAPDRTEQSFLDHVRHCRHDQAYQPSLDLPKERPLESIVHGIAFQPSIAHIATMGAIASGSELEKFRANWQR
jgi:hypothetical protein